MIRVRSGRGLGDSIYLRPIVEHLIAQGHRVCALSDYPQVFDGSGALVVPFTRTGTIRVAHYVETMTDQSMTQYACMLRRAGIAEPVPLRFAWTIKNRRLIDSLTAQAAGRPLVLVHGGRVPMQRTDRFADDLVPKRAAFETALSALADCYRVRIGKAPNLYPLPVDVDLGRSTSIADLLDLASVATGIVAQCSFAVPLAEALDRPLLAIWAAAGLNSRTPYIRTITPAKVLTSRRSRFVVDDWPADKIAEAALAFRAL